MRSHLYSAILTICLSMVAYIGGVAQTHEHLHPHLARVPHFIVDDQEPLYIHSTNTDFVERILDILQYHAPELLTLRTYLRIDLARLYYNNQCSAEDANRCLEHGYSYIKQLPTQPEYLPVIHPDENPRDAIRNAILGLLHLDINPEVIYLKIASDIATLYASHYYTRTQADTLEDHLNTQFITAILEFTMNENTENIYPNE